MHDDRPVGGPVARYPIIEVAGSALERGRQYGEQARDRIEQTLATYAEQFAHWPALTWSSAVASAAKYRGAIERFAPAYLDELLGIAEGANVPIADVVALNARTELLYPPRVRTAFADATQARAECSAFAVLPEASATGETLIGQNWDWVPSAVETVLVVKARNEDGTGYVTVVEAGLLAKVGFNSSGIGVVTNALVTDSDCGGFGVPYHVLLRGILDAQTLTDAIAILQQAPRASSANYLIADVGGAMINVEAAPGDFTTLFFLAPCDGVLAHTNHFLSPRFAGTDVMVWIAPHSLVRLQRLEALLAGTRPLSLVDLQTALSDHVGYPLSVCCHPDPREGLLDQSMTAVSVIMELARGRMHVTVGPPCAAPYVPVECAEFFGMAAQPRSASSARGE
jgi:isopenicillin-N N-acyltransferase-like protein